MRGSGDHLTGSRVYASFGSNGPEMPELGGNEISIGATYFQNGGGMTVHPNDSKVINGDVFTINFGAASGYII